MKHLFLLCFLIFSAFNISAEEGFEDEFSDEFDSNIAEIAVVEEKKPFYGALDVALIQNTHSQNPIKNLSSAKVLLDLFYDDKIKQHKTYLNLKGYYDFIYSGNLGNYSKTPDGYEREINLNEAYISGSFSPQLDYKIGRQIVVWGKSDSIRITDILNPLDNRIPGMVDIKNLRLGRLMTKLDYYQNDLNFSLILLHENRFSKNPKSGSDFKQNPDLPEQKPANSLDNTGVAISMLGSAKSIDFGVYFARIFQDNPVFDANNLVYDNRLNMLGFAYNQVLESYLFKAEFAQLSNLKYSQVADKKSRTDLLLGVEYSGIADANISYEMAYRNINNYDTKINTASNQFTPKKTYQQSLRFTQSYKNQTLDFTALLTLFGQNANKGGFARLALNYEINDNLSIDTAFIDYQGGSALFDPIKNNDKLQAKFHYAF